MSSMKFISVVLILLFTLSLSFAVSGDCTSFTVVEVPSIADMNSFSQGLQRIYIVAVGGWQGFSDVNLVTTDFNVNDGNIVRDITGFPIVQFDVNGAGYGTMDYNLNFAGNGNCSRSESFFVATVPPEMTSLTASVNGSTVTLNYSAVDSDGPGIKHYWVSKDGNNWIDTNNVSYDFTSLANGTYTFYVKVSDLSDNNSDDMNVQATVNVTSTSGYTGPVGGGYNYTLPEEPEEEPEEAPVEEPADEEPPAEELLIEEELPVEEEPAPEAPAGPTGLFALLNNENGITPIGGGLISFIVVLLAGVVAVQSGFLVVGKKK